MRAFTFDHVSDETLLADLAALVETDRRTTAALLAHLGEVDERKLYLPAACSSMHTYCVRVLNLAEEVAFKRIRAARIARRFPVIFDAITDGRLHVSGVVLLAPHLTEENVDEVLAAASHRTKTELEELVARLAPRPDLPERMTRVSGAGDENQALQVDLDPPGRLLDPDPPRRPLDLDPAPARLKARSPDRYALEVTIDGATRDKILRAQAILRHRNPSGDLAQVLDYAFDAALEKLEKEKFGKTSRPRKVKARGEDADPRHVPNEVRRVVTERDGEQCGFVSDDGVRCTERGFLELDHRTMVCRGGQPTAEEMRWRCRPHNQFEAERLLGADFMRAKRDQARKHRDRAAGASDAEEPARERPVDRAGDRNRGTPEPAIKRGEFDADVTLALRGLGFAAAEVRRAMEATAEATAATLEARLRAALAVLTPVRPFRCSEGAFDQLALTLRCESPGFLSGGRSGRLVEWSGFWASGLGPERVA